MSHIPGVQRQAHYDARGLLLSEQRANHVTTSARYDVLQRLEALETHVDGAPAQTLGYRYDRVGNLLEINEVDPILWTKMGFR